MCTIIKQINYEINNKKMEIYNYYTQGCLILTDQEENELISKIQTN